MRLLLLLALVCTCVAVTLSAAAPRPHDLVKRETEDEGPGETAVTDENGENTDEEEDEDSQEISARSSKKKPSKKPSQVAKPNKPKTKKPAVKPAGRPTRKPTRKPKPAPNNKKDRKKKPKKVNNNAKTPSQRENRRKNRKTKPKKPPQADSNKKEKVNKLKNKLKGFFKDAIQTTKESVVEFLGDLAEDVKAGAIKVLKEVSVEWLSVALTSGTCTCTGATCDCCADIPAVGSGCLSATVFTETGLVDLEITKFEDDGEEKTVLASTSITGGEDDEEMRPEMGFLNPGLRITPVSVESMYEDDTGLRGCFEIGLDAVNFAGTWCIEHDGSSESNAAIAPEKKDYLETFVGSLGSE